MRIIFHLGSYKTGTTSFQNMVFENRDLLSDRGVLYPRTGLTNEKDLGHRHTSLIWGYLSGKADACPDALLEELRGSHAHTAILSSEAWAHPGHLSHLIRLVTRLEDHGFSDHAAMLVLRNLPDYQVSHYREFTVNRNNTAPYADYVRKRPNLFDYLLLTQSFRAMFGPRLSVIPYMDGADMTGRLFQRMGLGALHDRMEKVARANTKPFGPLEIEAIRCAKELKKPQADGLAALSSLLAEDDTLREATWTERFADHVPALPAAYRQRFQDTACWSTAEAEAIFREDGIEGRNVAEITAALMDRLRAM